MSNYLARSVTGLPSHLPSCQTLVYNSGQWPDYPKNFPENVDYRKALVNLESELLTEIITNEKPSIYYYANFKIEAIKILEERKNKRMKI
jgi:hypothetical protein